MALQAGNMVHKQAEDIFREIDMNTSKGQRGTEHKVTEWWQPGEVNTNNIPKTFQRYPIFVLSFHKEVHKYNQTIIYNSIEITIP